MREALTYMFKDNKFCQKGLYFFLVYFVSILGMTLQGQQELSVLHLVWALLVSIIGFIAAICVYGYFMSAIKALKSQNENYILPMFNLNKSFKLGLKFTVASAIFAFVLCTIFFALGLVGGIFSQITNNNLVMTILFLVFMLLFLIVYVYKVLALSNIFAETEAFTSLLQIRKAGELIKQNPEIYNRYFWQSVLFGLIATVAILFIIITFSFIKLGIISSLISVTLIAILGTYCSFVNMYLFAKAVK